ncbi:MAG: hypothetical protein AAGC63_15760 [Propionicimonas sp.]|nr:hypothetical protein [Propionicimonas sp.]
MSEVRTQEPSGVDELDEGPVGFTGNDVGIDGFTIDGQGNPWDAHLYITDGEQTAFVELTPRVLDGLLDWFSTLEAARTPEPSRTDRAVGFVGWVSGWTVADRLRHRLGRAPLWVRTGLGVFVAAGVVAAMVLR